MPKDQWIIKNNTDRCLSVGDLQKLPAIWPGKVIDLLNYYEQDAISNSASLKQMLNLGWLEVTKIKNGERDKFDNTNEPDEAVTTAEINEIGSDGADLLNTKGDLLSHSTENVRLGVGIDGQVLTADSAEPTGIKWGTNPAGVTDHLLLSNIGTNTHAELDIFVNEFKQPLSTGFEVTPAISINGDNTKFDLSAGTIVHVDSSTNPPTVTEQTFGPYTAVTPTFLASETASFISIDINGNIVQRSARATAEQRRTTATVGLVSHVNNTTIDAVVNTPVVNVEAVSQTHDVIRALGFFSTSGNQISGVGGTLTVDKTAGGGFALNENASVNIKDPHNVSMPALSPATMFHILQDATIVSIGATIDPTIYDNGGVSTTVPANNNATISYVYIFPNNSVVYLIGQEVFANFADAIDAAGTENVILPSDIADGALLLARVILKKNATDITDSNEALIIPAASIAGGGATVTTMQQAYDVSSEPEIITDSTRGSVTLQRGSASDDDKVFEIKNGAGTVVFSVDGNGFVVGGDVTIADSVRVNARVNEAGGITKGQVVTISGATGGLPQVSLADNTDFSLSDVLAVANETQSDGQNIVVTVLGLLENIDTSAFSEGDILYLGTSGNLTATHPSGRDAVQRIGHAVKINASTGSILVELDQLTVGNNHNGTVRHQLVNQNNGGLAGAAYTIVNDTDRFASFSITSSAFSVPFPAGDGTNNVTLYNQGYGDTFFTIDGNKSFYWITDTTDSHNFSATVKMALTAAGRLGVGTATPISTFQSAGSFATKTTTVATNAATLDTTDHIVLVDDDDTSVFEAVNIALPAASGNDGLQYTIKKVGNTENVIINGNGSETIDGSTTHTLTTQYEFVTIVCDGSNWWII